MPDDALPPEPPGGDGAPPLEELYDPVTLAAIEAWARHRVAGGTEPAPEEVGDPPSRTPRSFGASLLAAGLLGLADALEGRDDHHEVVEEAPEQDLGDEPVTFLFVPGDPEASRIIVRPWLLDD